MLDTKSELNDMETKAMVAMTEVYLKCRGWADERIDRAIEQLQSGYNQRRDYYWVNIQPYPGSSLAMAGMDGQTPTLLWPGGDVRALLPFYAGRL